MKTHSPKNRKRKGGFLPALCNILGTLLLLAVIVTCLPLTVPRFFGYDIFDVVSGSMEPELPVGSVVYSRPVSAPDVEQGDVIVFRQGDATITHRVVENRKVEGLFITRGDANPVEDLDPVPYEDLVGRVEHHIPVVGRAMMIYTSGVGKIYVLGIALCGLMFNVLAGLIRDRRADREARREIEQELSAHVESMRSTKETGES